MRKLVVLMFFCMLGFMNSVHAQSGETVYKEWAFLGESATHLDVSYRVIKCDTKKQVHLQVFNESPNDQVAKFEIEITNASDGAKFTKMITFSVNRAVIANAQCNNNNDDLKIDLPDAYDPSNLTVKITFK